MIYPSSHSGGWVRFYPHFHLFCGRGGACGARIIVSYPQGLGTGRTGTCGACLPCIILVHFLLDIRPQLWYNTHMRIYRIHNTTSGQFSRFYKKLRDVKMELHRMHTDEYEDLEIVEYGTIEVSRQPAKRLAEKADIDD